MYKASAGSDGAAPHRFPTWRPRSRPEPGSGLVGVGCYRLRGRHTQSGRPIVAGVGARCDVAHRGHGARHRCSNLKTA